MKRSRTAVAALALLAGLLVAGCGGSSSGGGSAVAGLGAKAPAAGSQHRGGTLTVLSNEDVDNVDPGISWDVPSWGLLTFVTQRQLLQYKPSDPTHLVPDIAAAMPTISADNRQITVKLKPDVEFSPPVSRPVTSADIRYAIERGFTRNVASGYAPTDFIALKGAPAFMNGKAAHIAGIETPSPTTIVFKLSTPTAGNFVGVLTEPLASPVPAEYARRFDAQNPSTYGTHQVATGPYMIANDSSGTLTGYTPKWFTYFIGDAHIYENHLDMLREQLTREPLPAPRLELSDRIPDRAVTGRYEPEWLERVEPADFSLVGYRHHPPLTAPMAV